MGGQPQFYLEQDFPFHPKVVKAGGDAAWLYVCALAWATKHLTGQIPKALVPQLSDRKNVTTLSQRLVSAGLWIDRGEHYEIHDFETRNKKALAARRKAKGAAQARWEAERAHGENHAWSIASSNAPSNARAMLGRCLEPRNQGTIEPRNLITSPPPLTVVRDNATAEAVVDEVVEAVSRRQLDTAANVYNPSAWLAKAKTTIRTEWAAHILEHHVEGVEVLVDRIQPAPVERPRDPNSAHTVGGRTFLPGSGWVS